MAEFGRMSVSYFVWMHILSTPLFLTTEHGTQNPITRSTFAPALAGANVEHSRKSLRHDHSPIHVHAHPGHIG